MDKNPGFIKDLTFQVRQWTQILISAICKRYQRVKKWVMRLLWGTGTSWGVWTGCEGPTGLKGRTSSVLPERWMASCTSTSVRPGMEMHVFLGSSENRGRLVTVCQWETPNEFRRYLRDTLRRPRSRLNDNLEKVRQIFTRFDLPSSQKCIFIS